MPVYPRSGVRPVRGEGCYLFGENGERYLDFASGIAVNALGHGHPHLVEAIQRQAATLMHVSNLYGSPQGERLAQRLADNSFADTVFFTNSGAEAIECAIKTARRFHHARGAAHRTETLSLTHAFHGRTLGAISATNQEKLRDGFAPLLPGFAVVEFDNLDAARAAASDRTAGFLAEPLQGEGGGKRAAPASPPRAPAAPAPAGSRVDPSQGEGGVKPASPAFLQGLRDLADEHDALLIFDEVQCGMGRTGALFAYQKYGVTPDVMAIAKAIGGGFPLGACPATASAAAGLTIGTHGSAY